MSKLANLDFPFIRDTKMNQWMPSTKQYKDLRNYKIKYSTLKSYHLQLLKKRTNTQIRNNLYLILRS